MTWRTCGLTAATAVLCLGVTLGGQSAPTTATPRDASERHGAQPVTIAGCLVLGLPNGTSEKSAGAATANADEYFVRTPTVQVPAGATVTVGTPGTASTATSSGTPAGDSFYRIAGLDAAQLRPHLGHRVEIQGRLTDNMPGAESPRATTTQDKEGRATTTAETQVTVAGVVRATAIRMVSPACDK